MEKPIENEEAPLCIACAHPAEWLCKVPPSVHPDQYVPVCDNHGQFIADVRQDIEVLVEMSATTTLKWWV